MQGPIHVKSEIGPLQKVLLHRPGRELEYLVPDALERLLFDDIPYLHGAQRSMTGSCSFCEKTAQRSYSWRI